MADTSLLMLLPRVGISMLVVVGLMWFVARYLQRRDGIKTFQGARKVPMLQVLARTSVGRRASIAVVRTGDKTLVVGVTDSNVNVLSELETSQDDQSSINETVSRLSSLGVFNSFNSPPQAHGTGLSGTTSLNLNDSGSADVSSQTWKGLLAQIQERTVRH